MDGHVHHWRHGWIPLSHFAALQKAHGSRSGAARFLDKSNGHHGTESHKLGEAKNHSVGAVKRHDAADVKAGDILHVPSAMGGKTKRFHIDKAYAPKSTGDVNVDVTNVDTGTKHEMTLPAFKQHDIERRH